MTARILRLPSQSLNAPEKTLVMAAVASATPSMKPTAAMLMPSETNSAGSRLCTSSDEASMNRLTKPSAQMPLGIFCAFFGRSIFNPPRGWLNSSTGM